MNATSLARRLAIAQFFAIALAGLVNAEPATASYQTIVSMLDRMTVNGVDSSLRVVIEALVIGDEEGGKTAERLIEGEKSTIDSAISAHFAAGSGFRLLGIEERPFAAISEKGDSASPAYSAALAADDASARLAHDDARFFIMVRIVDYHSGRYDLAETRSQLMDRASGNKLGLDVAWSSQVDGIERSLFVDGSRIR